MSTAFAPTSRDAFDDEFDLDMSYGSNAHVEAFPTEAATDPREPLQFMAPIAAPAPALEPASVPANASSFNPVADLVAGANAAFQPPVPSFQGPAPAAVSVPRIAIHVFAERQDTLAAAERAGQDRRLSRATTQIRVGGVAAAVEAYQHETLSRSTRGDASPIRGRS